MSSTVFPIALRAGTRHALVVGGGNVAARKSRALLAGGFRVVVVAPAIDAALRSLGAEGGVTLHEREYAPADVRGAAIAVAATGDDSIDAHVIADARACGVIVCDATRPERGDFTMMATLRLGDLTIAIESGGSSPSFSRRMLDEIETGFGTEYAAAARTLARIRKEVRSMLPREERIDLLRRLSVLPVAELGAANAPRHVVCASRSSALATTQTRAIAALAAQRGIATEILDVTTAGDRDQRRALHDFGEANVFVTELEAALKEGRAAYAVHSAKDLPSELAAGMTIAAFSVREDARDAFCSERYERFDDLPAGAVVGTSSPRRRAQLQALRPDLRYETLRGNVDTRLRKLRDGEYDAIVLAMAGLRRLNVRAARTVPWPVETLVPAAGQGALAVETRAGDTLLAYELWAAANDVATERCVRCERAALRTLRAGCSAPIGIHATLSGERMCATLAYATPSTVVRDTLEETVRTNAEAEALGDALARRVAARVAPLSEARA